MNQTRVQESLAGIVERVTYHNEQNGWSVLKVTSFRDPGRLTTVLIHQAKVFAGATMEFTGEWTHHPKHGQQFKASQAIEKKPASAAALEKYLGSGLIKGIGPAIAKRIVHHFSEKTLDVFESRMDELMRVPGIAEKKLEQIRMSWEQHRAVRDVMIFLQGYGISTLFATKIYKTYGDKAIEIVGENPYRLAHDIYGIGFFSADKVALSMGFERTGIPRIEAGIKHVLAASREEGHCYLTEKQIIENTLELLRENIESDPIIHVLKSLLERHEIKLRKLQLDMEQDIPVNDAVDCYYSKSLYFDEVLVAKIVTQLLTSQIKMESMRVLSWVQKYCTKNSIQLSKEQEDAVCGIPSFGFSILTGGPGCGKTTCTRVLVQLLIAMHKRILLAAPTGRAAQRMSEVIGVEAKTIHRLLEWAPHKNGFQRNENNPLATDFLIVDETSMLDINLAASLLKSVPEDAQVLFIGDPDQLPAVGAGDVLADLLKASQVPRFRLTQVFRQAQASSIIRFAHEINRGVIPKIQSPLAKAKAFAEGHDCLFVDADEATQDQIKFIQKAKYFAEHTLSTEGEDATALLKLGEDWKGRLKKTGHGIEVDSLYRPPISNIDEIKNPVFVIPEKFKHVNLETLSLADSRAQELFTVLSKVHPWSSLHYGLTAVETLVRLYTKSIPEWFGDSNQQTSPQQTPSQPSGQQIEIQILSPQLRGTLGTLNLNQVLQQRTNPESPGKKQIQFGSRILREGDRVIQTRNNYDLGVFNGDIGCITQVDNENLSCEVLFSGSDQKSIVYENDDLTDLSLAYAITIHKSQGSEFQVVILPVIGQHFNMLFRNLIYTGLTRAKKLAIFVGSRKALAIAIGQVDNRKRQTALARLIR